MMCREREVMLAIFSTAWRNAVPMRVLRFGSSAPMRPRTAADNDFVERLHHIELDVLAPVPGEAVDGVGVADLFQAPPP